MDFGRFWEVFLKVLWVDALAIRPHATCDKTTVFTVCSPG